jgi:hypothetical protein
MLTWKIAAVVGVALGVAGVTWGYAQQSHPPGFFELRVYTAVRIAHALDLPENLDRVAGLELLLQPSDNRSDVARNAAEIATLNAGIYVIDRLDIGLVQVGRDGLALQRRHVAQESRYRWAIGGECGGYRRIAEFVERAHLMDRARSRRKSLRWRWLARSRPCCWRRRFGRPRPRLKGRRYGARAMQSFIKVLGRTLRRV